MVKGGLLRGKVKGIDILYHSRRVHKSDAKTIDASFPTSAPARLSSLILVQLHNFILHACWLDTIC